MTSDDSPHPISCAATWGSALASTALERSNNAGISPKPATADYARYWSNAPGGILRRRNPKTEALAQWATRIAERRGKCIAAVALARKLATILFAMSEHKSDFQPERLRGAVVQAAA